MPKTYADDETKRVLRWWSDQLAEMSADDAAGYLLLGATPEEAAERLAVSMGRNVREYAERIVRDLRDAAAGRRVR